MFTRGDLAILVTLTAVILYIYRGAFSGFFEQDDFGWLVDSRFHSMGDYLRCFFRFNPARGYRPLSQETFFFIGQALFGMRPAGFHVMSFAIHLFGSGALYLFLRKFYSPFPSFVAALFYGVHSAHMTSVYWISAVPEPMAAACYVLSLLFFIRFDRTGGFRFYTISMIAAILGIMSKESILTLPLVMAAYCLIFAVKRWKWTVPYFALPAVYAVCRLMSKAGAAPYSLVFGKETFQNFFAYASWAAGFSETLLKLKLHWQPEINYPWIAAVFLVVIAGMLGLSKNRKIVLFALLWFVLALQPILYFSHHIYPYYLAPALLALSLMLAELISTMMIKKQIVGVVVAAVIICYGTWIAEASVKREGRWWTERSFISLNILRQMPGVARQVPPEHTAFMFGFSTEEFGPMQDDAAFKAYGFSPTKFLLFGLDARMPYDIEILKKSSGLDTYHCFVYSNGVISNHTSEFRQNPRAFYSFSPAIMRKDPRVRIDVNSSELVAGRDTFAFRVFNLNAQAIDLLYELNGQLQPPSVNWKLNGDGASVPLGISTPRGVYHWIGIRDSSSTSWNEWISIDVRVSVR